MENKKRITLLKKQKEDIEKELKVQEKCLEAQNKRFLRKNAFNIDTKGLEKMIKYIEK